MFSYPSIEEVAQVAESLGIHLNRKDLELYHPQVVSHLERLDDFVQSRDHCEPSPKVMVPPRQPGYRPNSEEDPLGAWLWKCQISNNCEGRLTSKTIAYKDHIAVAGIPMTFGTFAMEGFVPDFDATVVTRALVEGGTVIGKNAMNGFVGGYGFGSDFGDYWIPRNPHHTHHFPGGSSSGSAVAVAAKEVDIAFGGDQGGSIRLPSAWSGTLGLKPTFGLISHFGASFGWEPTLDYIGPITRTSEDAAAALDSVAGFDDLDPRQSRDTPRRMSTSKTLAQGINGLKIGVLREGFEGAEEDVRDSVLSAVDTLESAGATAIWVTVPEHNAVSSAWEALRIEGALSLFKTSIFGAFAKSYYPSSVIAAVHNFWNTHTNMLSPRTKLDHIVGELSRRNYQGRVYAKAQNARSHFVKAYDGCLRDVDAVLMPTCTIKAPRREAKRSRTEALEHEVGGVIDSGIPKNTLPFNYTGHPALAIPCGKSDGLPVSMQVVGRFFDEAVLLRIAYAFEHSVDWDSIVGVSSDSTH